MDEKSEAKKNADEMAGKIFDYICAACDEKEANNIFMELALGFITATIDIEKPIELIKLELLGSMKYSYNLALEEIIKVKNGNTENVVSERKSK